MKLFILCSLALCLFVLSVSCETNRFNGLVDEIIFEMEQKLINQSKTILKLPEISQSFSKKVLFFHVDGTLEVNGASVKNLSTIYRIGDVIPIQNSDDGTLSIQGTFGMKELSVKADMLDAKLGFIHIHDPVTVNVGKNAASFKVTLTYDENFNCKATLNYARVSQLGDFSISLGSGLLTGIEDELANFIVDRAAPTIQSAINAHIFPMVEESITKLDFCGKIF